MAEKGGTKKLAIITICIMLIMIGLSGCIGDDGEKTNKNICNFNLIKSNTRGNDNYSSEIEYVEDNFSDDSKISHKENIIIDPINKEAKLIINNNNTFYKNFGGKNWDIGKDVKQTSDGGYIIVGETESYGASQSDIWLIKIDNIGRKQWNKTFGGTWFDRAYSVQETFDGGYIIFGGTTEYIDDGGAWGDNWLIKTDKLGNMEWNRTFRDDHYNWHYSYSGHQTSDGGFIISSFKTLSQGDNGESDLWLIKTNGTGYIEWDKTFDYGEHETAYSVQQTTDSGFIIVGSIGPFNTEKNDILLIKTNRTGNIQWNKTFGGTGNELGKSIKQTSDEGYIIIGNTNSFGSGEEDIWLIKTNNLGEMEWNKTFGTKDPEFGYSIQPTFDNGYIIIGGKIESCFEHCEHFAWLIKIDSAGNMQWNSSIGMTYDDYGYSIQQTTDGGFIVVGIINFCSSCTSDIWLFKTNKLGNFNVLGDFTSINMLNGKKVALVNEFGFEALIPYGTSIRVQFSQDKINWYNSSGSLNEWDILKSKSNIIKISSLNWQGSNFYYRVEFSSENEKIPVLQYINISYIETFDTDKDNYLNEWEEFLGTNPNDANDTPLDTDKDKKPDGDSTNSQPWMDTDDDNDNYSDLDEKIAGTDPLDKDDFPIENEPNADDNNNKKSNERDYTIFLILTIIIILILILLAILSILKKKKK